jgi:quinol monooxygenase YgiN
MPTLPWKEFGRAEAEREYVALLTYLPLKHGWQVPRFLIETVRIMRQLRRSGGLLGYALRAELLAKRFFTLSAWEDEAALQRFVYGQPHAQTMTAMAPRMGPTSSAKRPKSPPPRQANQASRTCEHLTRSSG